MIPQVVAIVPFRKGSKRFPGKNLYRFDGIEPLWHRTYREAKRSELFSRIILATDYSIEELSSYENVLGSFRSDFLPRNAEISDDESSSIDVLRFCLEHVEVSKTEIFCLLQVTSPFRAWADLKCALEWIKDTDYQEKPFALYSVSESIGHQSDVKSQNHLPVNICSRTFLDQSDVLRPNGNFYFFNRAFIAINDSFYGADADIWLIDKMFALDIDYESDLQLK
jgi:CMP-N-acetylneuraminic acid synthetase